MIEGWNPVNDVKDEWAATKSIWGRLKVFLFYTYMWLCILACIYAIFVPFSLGLECIGASDSLDETTQGWIAELIRAASIVGLGFGLYAVRGGTTLPNMRFIVAVFIVCYADGYWHSDCMAGECFDELFGTWPVYLGWPVLAMICAYVERRVDGGTEAETEPLVV